MLVRVSFLRLETLTESYRGPEMTVLERDLEKQGTDKVPKMIHIAFEGEEKALCGKLVKEVFPHLADGEEDCIVCVDIWKGMHR